MIRNYTSNVPAEQSIENIERLLVASGAQSIHKEYVSGEVRALSFVIKNPETGLPVAIRVPADQDSAFLVIKEGVKKFTKAVERRLQAQARRTAWKLMYEWVHVQLSLIEMKQAELLQVFMPYVWNGEKSLYSLLNETKTPALGYSRPED
jgi:hypothetical protein